MSAKKIRGSRKSFEPQEEILSFSERTMDLVRENPYWLVGLAGAIILALGIVWGVHAYRQARERTAAADYAQVIERWPGSDPAAFKEWNQLSGQLQDYIKKHDGTESAANAKLDLAQAYFWMKRYDDSIKSATELLRAISRNSPLKPLIHYHLALAYGETGKIDQSIAQWETLSKEGVVGLDKEINWHLAMLYSSKKEYVKAVEQYEKALQAVGGYPDTSLVQAEMATAKLKVGQNVDDSKKGTQKKDQKS